MEKQVLRKSPVFRKYDLNQFNKLVEDLYSADDYETQVELMYLIDLKRTSLINIYGQEILADMMHIELGL